MNPEWMVPNKTIIWAGEEDFYMITGTAGGMFSRYVVEAEHRRRALIQQADRIHQSSVQSHLTAVATLLLPLP
jgi:hypothetical protein